MRSRLVLTVLVLLMGALSRLSAAEASGSIRGTVSLLGATTAPPLAGVKIRVLQGRRVIGRTRSDTNGVYSFESVAAGTYSVEFRTAKFVKIKQGGVVVVEAASTMLNVALPPRLRLMSVCSTTPSATRRWRVRNPIDVPVSFLWKVDAGQQGTATAMPPQTFSFFEAPTVANDNIASVFIGSIEVNRRLNRGRGCRWNEASVVVNVTNEAGGVGDALVTITDDATLDTTNGTTAADGSVQFSHLPINLPTTVSVVSTSGSAVVHIPGFIDGANFVPVTLPPLPPPPTGDVVVSVRDPHELPLAGAGVAILYADASPGVSGATDGSGSVSFLAQPTGVNASISVTHPCGNAVPIVQPFGAGMNAVILHNMPTTSDVTVTVLASNGTTPVPGAAVTIGAVLLNTDGGGQVTFSGVAVGPLTVVATHLSGSGSTNTVIIGCTDSVVVPLAP